MAQQFNRTMSLRTWPSMYGDYEFHDDDDDDESQGAKVNWEQVKYVWRIAKSSTAGMYVVIRAAR